MDAADKLMNKKGIIREELKRQTPQGEMLWKKATDRLREIRRRYAPLPKGVQMHADKIFPAAAIYLTVKEEIGQEKAFAVIENAAITGCAGYAKKLAGLMKVPGMRSLFVKVWDPMTRKMFGTGKAFPAGKIQAV